MANHDMGARESRQRLRELPSVDRLLNLPGAQEPADSFGRALLVEALREVLEESRLAIIAGREVVPADFVLIQRAVDRLNDYFAPTLRPVINGTGVIIHTNLGRAPLSESALAAMAAAAAGYSNLEYDLDRGVRGSRSLHAATLLRRLTGCGDALVVNNNAAAVLLMLTALCREREVIICRGQLVEIGGGFRVPDVMAQSGARLVEVGTTNRTHLRDYERAVTEQTGAILVAHHSNYRIVGFASEPDTAELAALAHAHGLPLLYDLGSGALLDTGRYGLAPEPTVTEALAAGADVVAFSGDKLLGGPQAGILCGAAVLLGKIRSHPLARAVRADKSCLAGLSATLTHYVREEAEREIPVWRMIALAPEAVRRIALGWAERLHAAGKGATVVAGESTVGGGSVPGSTLRTYLLALDTPEPDSLAATLRAWDPPIIGRIAQGRYLLDPRTILPGQEETVIEALLQGAPAMTPVGANTETA